jgi:polyphosphate kinase
MANRICSIFREISLLTPKKNSKVSETVSVSIIRKSIFHERVFVFVTDDSPKYFIMGFMCYILEK